MGVVKGMSNEVYHAQAGISSTAVKTVYKKSLAHWRGEKRSNSTAFALGSAVHAILLEPERSLVVQGPKTRRSKAFTEMEGNLQEDQILLNEAEYHVAKRTARGVLSNPTCREILEHPERQNEVSIFAECERTGLQLKTRPDCMIVSDKSVFDVKTTIDCSPSGFGRICQQYAYDLQAAFYLYTCQMAKIDVTEFSFIACEKSSPYVSHLHVVGPELMASATERMHKTLAIIANATEQDDFGTNWGDYSILELPKWL